MLMAEELSAGERVRIRADFPVGHYRTPVYIRGMVGTVMRKIGTFANPELLAYALKGPQKALYEVRFRQCDLWPDYAGSPNDTLDIDIYEHWLDLLGSDPAPLGAAVAEQGKTHGSNPAPLGAAVAKQGKTHGSDPAPLGAAVAEQGKTHGSDPAPLGDATAEQSKKS